MTHETQDGKLSYDVEPESFLESLFGICQNSKFVIIFGVTMAGLYAFHVWNRTRKAYRHIKADKPRECDMILRRSLVRSTSIISHKLVLEALESAANNCNDMQHALKCIDVTVYCPHLMNIKSKSDGLTPFHRVCLQGNTCLIQFMLSKGADPFVTTDTGEDAFCMAIRHQLSNPTKNDFSALELLMQAGCNPRLTNRYDELLKSAVNANHVNLVQWLLLHADAESQIHARACSVP